MDEELDDFLDLQEYYEETGDWDLYWARLSEGELAKN